MVELKQAVQIGLIAGLVSAFYPSIPTIIKFEYYKEKWFQIYVGLTLLIIIAIMVM
ncbi:MAG: hypothetical protein QXG39_04885 [Candidatus Aenigmatarchaeota archaeon]